MGRKNCKALIIALLVGLASCVKDKPGELHTATPGSAGNIFIVCEGNFGNGDGTLYAYQPSADSVYGDLYKAANNNQPLGDVFQSMSRVGDKLFLCINNSDKVVVVNAADRTFIKSISIPKPRYFLPVSNTRAYVSALYSNKIYIVDLQALEVTGIITLPKNNPEGMMLLNSKVIVSAWDTSAKNVFSIDPATGQVTQTFEAAGYAPQEALADKDQMLWVIGGNQPQAKTASLSRIDPSTGQLLSSFMFPADADAFRPVFNKTKDTLYFIEANYIGKTENNGVYRMGIHESVLPAVPFVPAGKFQYFWALGIDPATGHIYVGDPKGFVQKGIVYIYEPQGTKLDSFKVGLGPGHFYFDQ